MKTFCIVIILSLVAPEVIGDSVENFKCGVRYELAAALKQEQVCKQWRELHPMCNRDLNVAYSDAAPYVYKKSRKGEVSGVIPGKFFFISKVNRS